MYFQSFSELHWKRVSEDKFWMLESVFFDLLDYVKAHLDVNAIYAVQADFLNPLKNFQEMKPVDLFTIERENSWIDTLIKNNSITTFYQPIVRFDDGELKVIGQELLSRGVDEKGDIIPPFKMFEAARIRNRVFSLDRVCRMQSVRNASVVGDQLIFINFIPTAIYVPEHCLSTTFEIIKQMNIKPEQVVFEVVETDEVKDIEHLKSILNYYRSHGFKYALDDVGVGHNQVEKLAQMEPDIVKLAIEFTDGVSKDGNKQQVARSVLSIAHEIGALALAEGVELEEDLHFLKEMGFDLFQGYYFSKPTEQPVLQIDRKLQLK